MSGDKRPGLRRRLRVTMALSVALLVVFAAAASVGFLVDRNAHQELVARLDPARLAADRLNADLLDQETSIRGYALARSYPNAGAFLRPYRSGMADERTDGAQLNRLLAGYPQLRTDLRRLDAHVAYWHVHTAAPELRGESVAHRIPSDAALTAGLAQFDTIRADLASLDTGITAIRQAGLRRADRAFWLIVGVTAAGFAGFALLLAAVALTLQRSVITPLAAVGEDSKAVAGGDLDHKVEETGPAEIAALATDIEAMRSRIVLDLRTIAEREKRLQVQSDELARSNRDLEQFAYVASHDLQEPLRKVASFCQLLAERYGDQLDDRAAQYIDFAVDGAKRMQHLVNDLLAFSRVGRTTEGFVPVDLAAALAAAEVNLERRLAETGGTVAVTGPLPVVLGDRTLLATVFQNLISNSLKFRSEAPPRITVGAERRDDQWEVAVADNGIGIEPRFAERVFIIFQRLHTRDRYEGTGIGLAMCRKIVEFHGGTMWMDTAGGEGTIFRFTLPAMAAAPPADGPIPAEEHPHA